MDDCFPAIRAVSQSAVVDRFNRIAVFVDRFTRQIHGRVHTEIDRFDRAGHFNAVAKKLPVLRIIDGVNRVVRARTVADRNHILVERHDDVFKGGSNRVAVVDLRTVGSREIRDDRTGGISRFGEGTEIDVRVRGIERIPDARIHVVSRLSVGIRLHRPNDDNVAVGGRGGMSVHLRGADRSVTFNRHAREHRVIHIAVLTTHLQGRIIIIVPDVQRRVVKIVLRGDLQRDIAFDRSNTGVFDVVDRFLIGIREGVGTNADFAVGAFVEIEFVGRDEANDKAVRISAADRHRAEGRLNVRDETFVIFEISVVGIVVSAQIKGHGFRSRGVGSRFIGSGL